MHLTSEDVIAIAREGQDYFRPLVRYLMEISWAEVIKDFQEKRRSYVSCGYSK